jgi:hypothetical protein
MTPPLEWLKERWRTIGKDAVRFKRWAKQSGPFYCGSALAHIIAVVVFLSWSMDNAQPAVKAHFEEVDTEIKEPPAPMFILGTPPVRPTELSARSLALAEAPAQSQKQFDDAPLFEDAGGGTTQSSDEPALGGLGGFIAEVAGNDQTKTDPKTGVGIGIGTSLRSGNGGSEEGFNGLGSGKRMASAGANAEEETERAVAAALNWLRRHQHDDGSWSLTGFACHCHGESCHGPSDTHDDVLATSLGLLAFLSAGQSHSSEGLYQRPISRSVDWLLAQQSPEGGFASASQSEMTRHHIATLALSECYGMTGDPRLAEAAQRAIESSGRSWMIGIDGWRCAMLLSAQRFGLAIDPELQKLAAEWLAMQARQEDTAATRFPSQTATNVPTQIDDFTRAEIDWSSSPIEFHSFTPNPPSQQPTSEEVLECFLSRGSAASLDRRRSLLASQAKSGCATGSWPDIAADSGWAAQPGRFPTTCFAAILLAAGYRHLPMHRSLWTVPVASRPDQPTDDQSQTKR